MTASGDRRGSWCEGIGTDDEARGVSGECQVSKRVNVDS